MRKRCLKFIGRCYASILLILLLFSLPSKNAYSLDNFGVEYKTTQTQHFYIHYPVELQKVVKRVAQLAESAHATIAHRLKNFPEKTHIVMYDSTSQPNGSANVFLRPTIKLFMVPPSSDSELSHYDDWLKILIFHEYTHIIHLSTTSGVPKVINSIFGSIWNPNQTLPRWYSEGLAVYFESSTSFGGRIDSAQYQNYIRDAALSGRLLQIDVASNIPAKWPFGAAAYYYGSFFLNYIAQTRGPQFFELFQHDYGDQIVPYALNTLAKRTSNATFVDLWDEWQRYEIDCANDFRDAISLDGETKPQRLTLDGGNNSSPQPAPINAKFAFYFNDLKHEPSIVACLDSTNYSPLLDCPSKSLNDHGLNSHFSWTPDTNGIVYARAVPVNTVDTFFDLFFWSLNDDSTTRLSINERADFPAISNTYIAYVRQRHATNSLVARKISSSDWSLISSGNANFSDFPLVEIDLPDTSSSPNGDLPIDYWQQISTPKFSNDGRFLVYSKWTLKSLARNLFLWDTTTNKVRQLTYGPQLKRDPFFYDNRHVWFVADYFGTLDLFSIDIVTGNIVRKTRALHGIAHPALNQDKQILYYSMQTDVGWEIASIPTSKLLNIPLNDNLDSTDFLTRHHPSFNSCAANKYYLDHHDQPDFRPTTHHIDSPDSPPQLTKKLMLIPPISANVKSDNLDYQPWRWLAPQFWFPTVAFESSKVAYGFSTSASDLLSHHIWKFDVLFSHNLKLPNLKHVRQLPDIEVVAQYLYGGTIFNLSAVLKYQEIQKFNDFWTGREFIPYRRSNIQAQFNFDYPIRLPNLSQNLSLQIFAQFSFYRDRPKNVVYDPTDLPPKTPDFTPYGTISASYSIGSVSKNSLNLVGEGYSASAQLLYQDPILGADFRALRLSLSGGGSFLGFFAKDGFILNANFRSTAFAEKNTPYYTVGGYSKGPPFNVWLSAPDKMATVLIPGHKADLGGATTFATASGTYAAPLWDIEWGPGTLPIFLRQLQGFVSIKGGAAANGPIFNNPIWLGSVIAELQLQLVLGYQLPAILRLGVAYGLDKYGIFESYLMFQKGF